MSHAPLPVVVGLGEVLWDLFPDGPRFGGAPVNFVCAVAELAQQTVRPVMVSAVGTDQLGRDALTELSRHGVATTHVARLTQPTGQVLVTVDAAGKPSYRFLDDVAWDHLAWSPNLHEVARSATVVCFGTLAQRNATSGTVIRRFVEATSTEALRILDVNLRPPHVSDDVIRESLPLANVFKCNDAELPILAQLAGIPPGDDETVLRQLMSRYHWNYAALTYGAEGALLLEAHGARSRLPAAPTRIVDTVGAGDAYTAALALGLLQQSGHWSGPRESTLEEINRWAIQVAAYVCSQPGATPSFPTSWE